VVTNAQPRYDGPTLTETQLAFLKSIDSPTIANAVEPFKVRDRIDGFVGGRARCLFPELPTMVGHAVTVTVTNRPGPILGRDGFWAMWAAVEAMPKPSVIVMQDTSGAPHRVAYCGEVMATYATRLGAVGLITDGGVRDLEEVRALGFHYFAPFPVVSHANWGIVEVGVPVTIDGQVVRTGDVLHGDANGVVIVPYEVLAGLPEAVEKIRGRERQMMDFIKGPEFSLAKAREMSGY
jgi:4-hydroxy-4-methyl-2-oxoglutarate aldolase